MTSLSLGAPESIEWNGRDIHFVLHSPRGFKSIVTVSKYIRSRRPSVLDKQRVAANAPLEFSDRTEMKGIVGDLQYAAPTCRPDLSGGTSLVQNGDLTMEELSQANTRSRPLTAESPLRLWTYRAW